MIKDRDEKSKNNYKLFEQDTTKTKSGRRKIPLTQRSILLLKELKLKQQMKSNIVFCSEVGTYVAPRNYERTFQKVVEKANIEKCNSHTLSYPNLYKIQTFLNRFLILLN
jgi:site-specific recombinase XerC